MNDVILKPVITETSLREAAKGNFTFKVDLKANKPEIAKSVEEMFGVHVLKVHTITVKGRTKRSLRSRHTYQVSDWKKAIATLKQGEKIDLFDVTGSSEHTHTHA
jgi:large subunit ribosomal protein L23